MPGVPPVDDNGPGVPATVALARRAVIAHLVAADTPQPPLTDIGLTVSEAVTNVVHHAYVGHDDPGPVNVRVEIGADQIELRVQDEGSGMIPRPDSPGLGLGMPLIATVSDRLDVCARTGGGTRVCAWFDKSPAAATISA